MTRTNRSDAVSNLLRQVKNVPPHAEENMPEPNDKDLDRRDLLGVGALVAGGIA